MDEKQFDNIYNLPEDQIHLPDSEVLETEPTTGRLPMTIILIGLVIILIGILGGLIWWGRELLLQSTPPAVVPIATRPTAEENNEPESTKAEAEVETLGAMSTSDEIDAIESDLIGTNVDSLDAELPAIEAELEN
ncbi:hypothetical protein KC722_02295 [Candidatus Kaiserbacteria bacterium]|nr:hypothetical protein [Candidatus Kaiserbacteria bacterium]MCB9811457.1 hypothetical protein [Candidatus Nomurabacteria bacterium]